jgi:hypothetical protein
MKLNVPVDGLIDIDANGLAIVSDRAAKILVEGTNDWEYNEAVNTTSDKTEAASDEEKSEDEQVIAGIKTMKLADMIAMATEAGYPNEEWERFSKKEKLMAAYLIKKYNEAKLEEVAE